MLDDELLESVADFYGSFTLDEFADRLGVSTFDTVALLEDLVDRNLDAIEDEMRYDTDNEDEILDNEED